MSSILIVDDEAAIRNVLQEYLTRYGHRCELAQDVKHAEIHLRKGAFEICLLDVQMPGESGLDFLPRLRQRAPNTAPILLTAMHDIELAVTAMKLGAYDYLTKPFTCADVLFRVEKALEKRQLELEKRMHQEQLEALVEQRTLELDERNQTLEKLFMTVIECFALTLQVRSEYTKEHSQRVAYWAVEIARALGLGSKDQLMIYRTALLHDMGKVAVRDQILDKPGRLSREEYLDIQRHPEVAYDILCPIAEVLKDFKVVVEAVRHHHEYYDGTGYPAGLQGESIPLFARIISVADAYDSMTSGRAYREPMDPADALRELRRHAGSQFDPQIVSLFIAHFSECQQPSNSPLYPEGR